MSERTQPVSTPTSPVVGHSPDASTARFALPAEEFALADLFERVPDARVECESAVANPTDHALIVVRTTEREREVDAALWGDANIAAVERLGERPNSWSYRVTWDGQPRRFIQQLVAADVTILSARGQSGEWKFRLLAPEREGIARAADIIDDLGCGADCRRISTLDDERPARLGLSDEQREALTVAFELGYYNIPRDITVSELADELGISHQALSERFRRAHRHLVETELIVTEKTHRNEI